MQGLDMLAKKTDPKKTITETTDDYKKDGFCFWSALWDLPLQGWTWGRTLGVWQPVWHQLPYLQLMHERPCHTADRMPTAWYNLWFGNTCKAANDLWDNALLFLRPRSVWKQTFLLKQMGCMTHQTWRTNCSQTECEPMPHKVTANSTSTLGINGCLLTEWFQ